MLSSVPRLLSRKTLLFTSPRACNVHLGAANVIDTKVDRNSAEYKV